MKRMSLVLFLKRFGATSLRAGGLAIGLAITLPRAAVSGDPAMLAGPFQLGPKAAGTRWGDPAAAGEKTVPLSAVSPIERYLPMAAGNQWNYTGTSTSSVGGVRRMFVEGTNVDCGSSGWSTQAEGFVDGRQHSATWVWRVDRVDGWVLLAYKTEDTGGSFRCFSQPLQLLSANPTAGESHDFGGAGTQVEGEETISTPAYTGAALRMRWDDLGDTPYTEYWYLAKDVGLIKSESPDGTGNGWFFGDAILETLTCSGDCNSDGTVTVNEIIAMVNIALGNAQLSDCQAGDANGDGQITVDEILQAVNSALNGCV